MKKKLLININQDPRKSDKPLEGLRIATSLVTANIPVIVNMSKYNDLVKKKKYEEVNNGLLFFQYLQVLQKYNCLELNFTDIKENSNLIVLNF
jgi:hypothetical protein